MEMWKWHNNKQLKWSLHWPEKNKDGLVVRKYLIRRDDTVSHSSLLVHWMSLSQLHVSVCACVCVCACCYLQYSKSYLEVQAIKKQQQKSEEEEEKENSPMGAKRWKRKSSVVGCTRTPQPKRPRFMKWPATRKISSKQTLSTWKSSGQGTSCWQWV